MAISVASDQTLVNATGGAADETPISGNWVSSTTTAWATAPVYDGDMYVQNTGVIGARASGSGASTINMCHLVTGTANLDLTSSGYHVYFWIKCITLPAMDARVRGGIGLSISSTGSPNAATVIGTNPWSGINDSKQWFLTGSDFEGTSGWICYVVDPASTPDWSTGTPVMTSVDYIGIRSNSINAVGAGSFKPKNILWDALRYGTKLTITGSTGTFQDIYAIDSSVANQFGILNKSSGIFLGGGKLVFGTTGQSAPCIITDSKQTLVWQDFRVASGFYEIQLVGNTTPNTTTMTLGTYSGGLTSGGYTIRGVGLDTQRLIAPVIVSGGTGYTANDILTVSGGTSTVTAQFKVTTVSGGVITAIVMQTAGSYSVPPTGTLSVTGGTGNSATFTATAAGGSIWTLTASASNQTLNLYDCKLSEMKSAALASTSTLRGCTITNSGEITTNGATIDSCTFQDVKTAAPISATYAMIIASATEMSTITNSKFINCNIAIKITAAGTYTFNNLTFSGNTYDIENSSAGAVIINATNGANPVTYTNTGGGTTTINTSVNLTLTVKDTLGANIQSARSFIRKSAQVAMQGAVADDGGVETDETTASNNATANDMTLLPVVPVTGDAYNFGAKNPFWKLTLNIGTPGVGTWTIAWQYWNGAWTTIPSAGFSDGTKAFQASAGNRDVVFTPPSDWTTKTIQGISGYFIRADVAFTSITTQPKGTQAWVWEQLMNTTTNASGVATTTYNYLGDVAITYDVRKSSTGATKYIPVTGTGTIASTGFSATVTMTTDDIAEA